jgi:hypothetical protein
MASTGWGVGDGTRLLDIAYGSGFAAQLAARAARS